ncbi:vanadium-dependent haloperoxidase [Streptomyces sp. YIM 98790]|uniref:vanadium-dependent haloperoxidase n=1 Tax=Streptomyces sp. YIM 98790 TaxID=2689077 RepID=UPI00140D1CEE|nr:vanadium-dependent haloperoxidase [Streptomyces sp. YIM 98790]
MGLLLAVVALFGGSLTVAPQTAAAAPPDYTGDPVHYWNDVLLDVFRQQEGADGAPGRLARAAAMMNAAIWDGESSYRKRWHTMRYRPYINATYYDAWSEGPGEEERIIGRTAYNVLLHLFPDQAYYLDNKFTERFGTQPTDFDLLDITVVGDMVRQIESARSGDGSDADQRYSADGVPGAWRATSYPDMPDPGCRQDSQAVTPAWGQVRPFAIPGGSAFRPATPGLYGDYATLLASDAYAEQVEVVRRLGAKDSTERTTDQTAAAWFWAHDLDGTYKPPGQLLQHTKEVAQQEGLSTYGNARLFALVSLALADASIAAWDVKYRTPIDLWRPVSAIREGGLDPAWQPLSADRDGNAVNPCFPAWTSGHATFAGAWAGIMKRYFGTDTIQITLTSEDPHAPVKRRTFSSFSAAARENADSRVWLGVHYPWDSTDGLRVGDDVASYVIANTLQRIPS